MKLGASPAHGLAYDPAVACLHLCNADPALARLLAQAGAFTLRTRPTQSLFAALTQSIVYQQLSGKAAATILARVKALFAPKRFPTPRDILDIPSERLRAAGLSTAKTAALKDLAARTLDGTVPSLPLVRRMSDEEIIERLTLVRGVGRWTVEMLLMFRLGRPDVLPVGDLGVRKGFALTFGGRTLPDPEVMSRRAERWRPYRSVASWYLWRALEL
ncbi:MAG: DNA-3-methyladenine glycosylase 2 family protein [Gemmatimonadales bacterium]|nr:DNA-3-methyladenine glycosylase 2 family protein [Gemmatimonadales bacterium]